MSRTLKRIITVPKSFVRHILSKHKVARLVNSQRPIFIEVGSGDKRGSNGWTTIDVTKNCDLFWDLRKGIPFPKESISGIYSSHFLEHLTFKEGQSFLDECLRVLKPGGTFSICVPNARIWIDAYVTSETDTDKYFIYKPAYNKTTSIDLLNFIAYMDGHHKYMFDEDNLVHLLISKGLKNVRLRGFDPALDLKERDFGSIYAIAEK